MEKMNSRKSVDLPFKMQKFKQLQLPDFSSL